MISRLKDRSYSRNVSIETELYNSVSWLCVVLHNNLHHLQRKVYLIKGENNTYLCLTRRNVETAVRDYAGLEK